LNLKKKISNLEKKLDYVIWKQNVTAMRIFPRMVGGEALSPSPFTLIPILSSPLSYLLFMSKPGIFSRIKTEKFPTIIQFLRSQNTQKKPP